MNKYRNKRTGELVVIVLNSVNIATAIQLKYVKGVVLKSVESENYYALSLESFNTEYEVVDE